MGRKSQEQSILLKATTNSTFDILLKKAEQEGRVGGKHRCGICGMLFHSTGDAKMCCESLRNKK